MAARQGTLEVEGARLLFSDSGGAGTPVVLLHPATGNIRSWIHQQPVLAAAGYRVIVYSRRGHAGSPVSDQSVHVAAATDLQRLLDHLGAGRVHLVGVAAGGIYAADFALAFPSRVRSLAIAGSIVAVADPEYMKESNALRPPEFDRLPSWFRELGAQYRASDPAGVDQWLATEAANEVSPATSAQARPPLLTRITLKALSSLEIPVLLLTGDADLYTPPAMLARLANSIPGSSTVVIDGSGHSPHWERPDDVNRALLQFLGVQRR
jgi:pimeloyl-ACP methyl ester carboxylesterase